MNTSSFAKFPRSKRIKAAAFTLLELLVVISIIAVLAGILLPVTGAVMENARKTEAKSTESQIITAVKSFQTDYGVYPNPDASQTDVTWLSETNHKLFNILRNIPGNAYVDTANPRHIVYFDGKDAKSASFPKSGFATATKTNKVGTASFTVNAGALVDPWGAGFMVRYDTGYTDAVINPYTDATAGANDTAGATTGVIRTGIIAWSYGKNGVIGTTAAPGDDVVSWQ